MIKRDLCELKPWSGPLSERDTPDASTSHLPVHLSELIRDHSSAVAIFSSVAAWLVRHGQDS